MTILLNLVKEIIELHVVELRSFQSTFNCVVTIICLLPPCLTTLEVVVTLVCVMPLVL